jgi:hypothetical protein
MHILAVYDGSMDATRKCSHHHNNSPVRAILYRIDSIDGHMIFCPKNVAGRVSYGIGVPNSSTGTCL